MEFKSGPIQIKIGPKPRDKEADRATLNAIQAKLTADDLEGAVALAETALADGLEHPLTFNLAAGNLESQDRFSEALQILERGHKFAPQDPGLGQALALCHFRLQHFAQALTHFDGVLAAQPGFAPAHAARGATLEQLGQWDDAEGAYRRALELQPGNLLALAGLASTSSHADNHPQARRFAEQVLGVEPGYPDAVVVLARADLAEGYYADGEARLRTLMTDPRLLDAHRDLAKSLIAEIDAAKHRKFDA
jgi:tetratricopeptide (TPR) repeat protein